MTTDAVGTSWDEVVTILDALDAVGCRYWIDGGWGVDVLGGAISRKLRPVDDHDLAVLGAPAGVAEQPSDVSGGPAGS